MSRTRPDIEDLIQEHETELQNPAGSRKITRLQKFVLALQGIQNLEPTNHSSYYWLASYHGGSSPEVFTEQRRLAGSQAPKDSYFCAHGIQEFPSWHRVYLLKYEQALQEIDPDVMLPYWNHFSETSKNRGYPKMMSKRKIELADGSSIENPLRRYTLQDSVASHAKGERTARDAEELGKYFATEHPTYVKRAFENSDYDSFSNHSSLKPSIETPHDNVHVYVGGFMSDPTTAAFDPIFWLHHCFIDYLFWVWQLRYNQTTQLSTKRSNFKLIPFEKQSKVFYTVAETANISNFGYNYPEFDLKILGLESRNARREFANLRSIPLVHKDESSKRELKIEGVEFGKLGGSFKIKAYVFLPSGKVYLGVHSVFRAADKCVNCGVRGTVAAVFRLKQVREEEEGELEFKIKFELRDGVQFQFRVKMNPGVRYVERRFGNTFEVSY